LEYPEKFHSFIRESVAEVHMPYLDIIILFVNIFLPGIGTVASGFIDKS
tara:strand:+ start:360 stop:506 length:147 start_codon:yes stop_codon:yes gene_type:complete